MTVKGNGETARCAEVVPPTRHTLMVGSNVNRLIKGMHLRVAFIAAPFHRTLPGVSVKVVAMLTRAPRPCDSALVANNSGIRGRGEVGRRRDPYLRR